MTSKKIKKKITSGRPPTYKELVFGMSADLQKEFFIKLKAGEKVMLSFSLPNKSLGKIYDIPIFVEDKIQVGIFTVVKMKGYMHVSGADGSKRKLKPFNRIKFAPTKQFKEIVKSL